jgi:hypothetical protein
MKPRIRLSTLCLFIAVVALAIAVSMLNARFNELLRDVTARFNAELAEQKRRHKLELQAQDLEFQLRLPEPICLARPGQPGPCPAAVVAQVQYAPALQ